MTDPNIQIAKDMGSAAAAGDVAEVERLADQHGLHSEAENMRLQAKRRLKQQVQGASAQHEVLERSVDGLAARAGLARRQGESTGDLLKRIERVTES